MGILEIISKPKDNPPIITLTGFPGIGKTTLAAAFPKPVFERAENGLQAIPENSRPDAFPVLKSSKDLWEHLDALIKEDHDYKTLVIDSITQLDALFTKEVVDSDPKKPKSINQAMGGYGAGQNMVADMHQRVRRAAGILNAKKGMTIVFIGHSETSTIELPDQDAFTRYDLRLSKKSIAPYVDNVDLVGFMKLQTFVKDEKATTTGKVILNCSTTAANISKNRYGIKDDLIVEHGQNPLLPLIPFYNQKKGAKNAK